jgi:hypothetical protein
MIDDGVKELGRGDEVRVRDIAELLAERVFAGGDKDTVLVGP